MAYEQKIGLSRRLTQSLVITPQLKHAIKRLQLSRADLETLVSWLDPAKRPLYVLLPVADYDVLARPWSLPPHPEVAGSN